jgi:hypothetical protein
MLQREWELGRLLTVIARVCKYARSFSEADDMRKKKKKKKNSWRSAAYRSK